MNNLEQNHRRSGDLTVETPKNVLFYPWNTEGETNMEYHMFLNDVKDHFMGEKDFVAITQCGSQGKGYADEESDFDLFFIGRSAHINDVCSVSDEVEEIGKKYGRDTGVPMHWDKSFFTKNLELKDKEHIRQAYYHATWPLLYPLMGKDKEISELRELAVKKHEMHQKLHPANARHNYFETVDMALYWDMLGARIIRNPDMEVVGVDLHDNGTVEKMRKRGYADSDIKEMTISREKLWRERLDLLLSRKDLE